MFGSLISNLATSPGIHIMENKKTPFLFFLQAYLIRAQTKLKNSVICSRFKLYTVFGQSSVGVNVCVSE